MKAKSILAALLLLVAGLRTAWAQKVLLYKTNSQMVEYEVSELDSIVFVGANARLVTKIVLSETSIALQPNELRILTATVLPENAQNRVVAWESSDNNVAEVNQNGRVIGNANGICIITCRATDGSGVKAECKVTVGGTMPDENEWVDLGLPSGTLWATCNVGANSPEEYGDYFAWGETTTKNDYGWDTYKWFKGDFILTKYSTQIGWGFTDGKTELDPADDAATANWGSGWQMPSADQIDELINSEYTTTEWTTLNGVNGSKIISKNGNSIFLPAAGTSFYNTVGNTGSYWSRSLYPSNSGYACILYFKADDIATRDGDRTKGLSVRPVRVSSASPVQLVTGITVSPATLTLELGKTQTLTATVAPSDATNKKMTWTSSNTSVATVSASGKVTAVSAGICTITAMAKDGSGVKGICQVTAKQADINGHAYVEIGGLKWATMNVGATTVAGSYATCFGDYFAWGETEPRYRTITRSGVNSASFTWRNGYSSGYDTYPDYTGTTLDSSHDAATAKWGGTWRTPKLEEFKALAVACSGSSSNGQKPVELINTITEGGIYWLSATQTIESAYTGVAGLLFVSKADISKRVFFPACGCVNVTSLYDGGTYGGYWSSSLYFDTYYAFNLYFYSSYVGPSNFNYRYYGRTVRPVSY